jgi:hypothetical protein
MDNPYKSPPVPDTYKGMFDTLKTIVQTTSIWLLFIIIFPAAYWYTVLTEPRMRCVFWPVFDSIYLCFITFVWCMALYGFYGLTTELLYSKMM